MGCAGLRPCGYVQVCPAKDIAIEPRSYMIARLPNVGRASESSQQVQYLAVRTLSSQYCIITAVDSGAVQVLGTVNDYERTENRKETPRSWIVEPVQLGSRRTR